MSKRQTFMDRALSGEIEDPEEIVSNYIGEWHESATALPLHRWLGFTQEEYALFVEKPEFLPILLHRIQAERRHAG